MTIILSSDHAGFLYKKKMADWLVSLGHTVVDAGPDHFVTTDDYPVYARKGARQIKTTPNSFGIFICGSGAGMVIVANRFPWVRAVAAETAAVARRSRDEDDANVLVIGSRIISFAAAKKLVAVFLKTPFSGLKRHQRRIDMLSKIHGS